MGVCWQHEPKTNPTILNKRLALTGKSSSIKYAQKLLESNGFVCTTPEFYQFMEPNRGMYVSEKVLSYAPTNTMKPPVIVDIDEEPGIVGLIAEAGKAVFPLPVVAKVRTKEDANIEQLREQWEKVLPYPFNIFNPIGFTLGKPSKEDRKTVDDLYDEAYADEGGLPEDFGKEIGIIGIDAQDENNHLKDSAKYSVPEPIEHSGESPTLEQIQNLAKRVHEDEVATVEQPKPNGKGVVIGELVLEDIRKRIEIGEKKYGEKLTSFNGRRSLVDAYQEAVDLVFYLRQAIEESRPLYEVRAGI